MFAPLVSPVFFVCKLHQSTGYLHFKTDGHIESIPGIPAVHFPCILGLATHRASHFMLATPHSFLSSGVNTRSLKDLASAGYYDVCGGACCYFSSSPWEVQCPFPGLLWAGAGAGAGRAGAEFLDSFFFLFFCSAGAQIVLNVPIFLNGSKTSLCDMAWLYLGCSCSWFVGTPAEVLHWMMLVRTSYFMVDLGIGSYWVYHTK